ncbi:MAG: VPLPA-CTERM sorting domain-containing protein [Thermodesulfobacteriota bacterium]|nr:VPLPA-CTERM sorting domain-containing protein [Thermodesulfobacteriota bacterium]
MKRSLALLVLVVLSATGLSRHAQAAFVDSELIDFEGLGLVEGAPLSTVTIPTNVVTFFTDVGTCYVAEVGAPEAGFWPEDTPVGGSPGNFFLSDDLIVHSYPYNISFSLPVSFVSLDLYDFRADQDGMIGHTATLEAFADLQMTVSVGADTFTVPSQELPDGNVVTLSVLNPSANIIAASLTYDEDAGTGIDNIRFDTVAAPIPSALWLLGSGLIGLVGLGRKSRR